MDYPRLKDDTSFNRFAVMEFLDLNPGQKYVEYPMIMQRLLRFLNLHGYTMVDAECGERVHLDLQLISSLSLDGIGTKRSYAKPLGHASNKWVFRNDKKSLSVIRKMNCLGMSVWSGDLMEELHDKIESSSDAAATFQLALRIIEELYVKYLPKYRLFQQMKEYWTLLRNLISSERIKTGWPRLVVDIFRTFCSRKDVYCEFFAKSLDLCFFFNCAQSEKFPVWGLWRRRSAIAEVTHCTCFFSTNTRNFTQMLTFGVRTFYYWPFYNTLKAWIVGHYRYDLDGVEMKKFVERLNGPAGRMRIFRVLQACFQISRNSVAAMKMLWCCIPDPLLTFSDFLLLAGNSDFLLKEVLHFWTLYGRHVNSSSNHVTTPRTLKHLSRCAVRSKLAESFQLPRGIDHLRIPQSLHQYLKLTSLDDF